DVAWCVVTSEISAALSDPYSDWVKSVAFGPGGSPSAGDVSGSVFVWDVATRKITAALSAPDSDPGNEGVNSVAFGPGGVLASGDESGSTFLWHVASRSASAGQLSDQGQLEDRALAQAARPADQLRALPDQAWPPGCRLLAQHGLDGLLVAQARAGCVFCGRRRREWRSLLLTWLLGHR